MESDPILGSLNPAQREAVLAVKGPVLILAGAGSGKTKTLTHRLAYLLKEGLADPTEVLCLTFTNKAAGEMRQRVETLLSKLGERSIRLPWLGTFHSLSSKLLRLELDQAFLGWDSKFVIYDEADTLTAVKRAMVDLNLDQKQFVPRAIRGQISDAKNQLVGPEEYERYAVGHFSQVVSLVYQRYASLLKSANALDFDDLLLLVLRLFKDRPEVLQKYRERFKYILVDEYQDTNLPQYQLVRLLAEPKRNLFVIGDDWQSIYSWRGANFRNILDFQKDYKEAQVFKLEQNYRSTGRILEAAQAVIVRNQDRSDKKLWTEGPIGPPITLVGCLNEKDEAEFVVREILGLVQSGAGGGMLNDVNSLSECVILYRTNAQSRALEELLVKYALPYQIVGGVRFYERKEIKDILAYLRLIVNPKDKVSLERVINLPARGIGAKTVKEVLSLGLESVEVWPEKARAFMALMADLRAKAEQLKSVSEVIDLVVKRIEFGRYLQDGSIEGEARFENVQELISAAMGKEDLNSFLEEVALLQDIDESFTGGTAGKYDGRLTLMTLHAAKGLEFPVVFIVGMEEGVLPHTRALTEKDQLEEERRLVYVGMTRAMYRLYLVYAYERRLFGLLQTNPPSRFISEIPVELIEKI